MRLIDADVALEALVDKGQTSTRYKLGEFWELNGQEIREVLNALPSAQPEIIRCDHCEYFNQISNHWGKCSVNYQTCQICDYCSWAERRNNG